MVNYIRLAWKLVCMLKTYRTCNSIIGFSKYEFNSKLLGGVTLLRVISGVTWTQPYLYIYIYIYEKNKKNCIKCIKCLPAVNNLQL